MRQRGRLASRGVRFCDRSGEFDDAATAATVDADG
jgi:hypothetical protein